MSRVGVEVQHGELQLLQTDVDEFLTSFGREQVSDIVLPHVGVRVPPVVMSDRHDHGRRRSTVTLLRRSRPNCRLDGLKRGLCIWIFEMTIVQTNTSAVEAAG